MALPVWPATLPQTMRLRLPITPLDRRARFEPDSGSPRTAVRTTAVARLWSPQPLILGETQLGILRTFYDTTCFHGQKAFEWTNPIPSIGLKTFQWHTPPSEVWIQQATPLPAAMPGSQVYRAGGASSQPLIEVTFQLLELPWLPAS